MSGVVLSRVAKHYGPVVALQELDLEIREGEFLTLLGPSGCGKTTTLRLIAGFIEPTSGQIYLGDDDVTSLPPQRREIGMVFQDYALFPHLTIRDNIGFGLKERGADRQTIDQRVVELLELVKLPGIEDRYPAELSGGQAQRVAVARAVAYPPRVLLMDEPLGALDLKLREAMQAELRRIQQELQITTIFVTHDQTEAMSMSDRIAVMNQGVLEQIGTAEEIYYSPRSVFVADFVGQINLMEGEILESHNGVATLRLPHDGVIRAKNPSGFSEGPLSVAIRPEHLRLTQAGKGPAENILDGTVISKSFSGSLVKLFIDVGLERPLVVEERPQNVAVEAGGAAQVACSPDDVMLLAK